MFDNKYLNSIYILLGVFILMIIAFVTYTIIIKKRKSNRYNLDLREYTLYLKYNLRTKKLTIENYQQ